MLSSSYTSLLLSAEVACLVCCDLVGLRAGGVVAGFGIQPRWHWPEVALSSSCGALLVRWPEVVDRLIVGIGALVGVVEFATICPPRASERRASRCLCECSAFWSRRTQPWRFLVAWRSHYPFCALVGLLVGRWAWVSSPTAVTSRQSEGGEWTAPKLIGGRALARGERRAPYPWQRGIAMQRMTISPSNSPRNRVLEVAIGWGRLRARRKAPLRGDAA